MHDVFPGPPDDTDRLLAAPAGSPDDWLRERVFARTRRVLRWRRWRRPLTVAALALLGATALLAWRWRGSAPPGPAPVVQRPPTEAPPGPQQRPSAVALEWQALETPPRRAALYRQAGQRYLDDEGDPLSAVRCYGAALDASTPADRTISPDDDWLLMAIKHARQKEKNDAEKVD